MERKPKTDTVFTSFEDYSAYYMKKTEKQNKGTRYYQIGEEVAQMACKSILRAES